MLSGTKRNPTKSVGLVESGLDHISQWKLICSRHDIAEALMSWCKQQSISFSHSRALSTLPGLMGFILLNL
jgi:hypothetical protein